MTETRPRIPDALEERLERELIEEYGYDEREVYGSRFVVNLERLLEELEDQDDAGV